MADTTTRTYAGRDIDRNDDQPRLCSGRPVYVCGLVAARYLPRSSRVKKEDSTRAVGGRTVNKYYASSRVRRRINYNCGYPVVNTPITTTTTTTAAVDSRRGHTVVAARGSRLFDRRAKTAENEFLSFKIIHLKPTRSSSSVYAQLCQKYTQQLRAIMVGFFYVFICFPINDLRQFYETTITLQRLELKLSFT